MHELSIARDILSQALHELEKHGCTRISAIHVRVGGASHIEPGSLELCLEVVARGTAAEGARLEIELIPSTMRCRDCGSSFTASPDILLCPHCNSSSLEALAGNEVSLISLEVD